MRLEKSEKERQEEKVFEAERVVHTGKEGSWLGPFKK